MNAPGLLCLLGVLLFSSINAAGLDWHSEDGYKWATLPAGQKGRAGFTLLAPGLTGVTFTNLLEESAAAANRVLLDGSGVAAGDFDHDGRVDLVVTQNGAQTRLMRNVGGKPGLRVRLMGPLGNPDAVGASLRLVFPSRRGPMREIHAGSGYWSQDSAAIVFGTPVEPAQLWIRWPGGRITTTPIPPSVRELTVDQEGQAR